MWEHLGFVGWIFTQSLRVTNKCLSSFSMAVMLWQLGPEDMSNLSRVFARTYKCFSTRSVPLAAVKGLQLSGTLRSLMHAQWASQHSLWFLARREKLNHLAAFLDSGMNCLYKVFDAFRDGVRKNAFQYLHNW